MGDALNKADRAKGERVMINANAIKWLENLKKDIGNPAHQSLWHYEQALTEIIDLLADRKTEQTEREGE